MKLLKCLAIALLIIFGVIIGYVWVALALNYNGF